MSKARLVITAVTVEKRPVSEVARSYGVARSWVYELLARYGEEGEAAFEPRSRRPKTSPRATAPDTVELITRIRKELAGQGLDAGPHTIAWHLGQHHQLKVSPATVSRTLTRHGLVTPDPSKRPPLPTPAAPRPAPATGPPTPTTASAPTASTPPGSLPSATTAGSTTSASAAPMPEPASCSWSRTCTSASSTPTPASSCASSPSTRPGTTSPPAAHPAGQRKHHDPDAGSRCPRCLATSQWWQVLGSNQRRLSRRFYRELPDKIAIAWRRGQMAL